MIEQSEAQYFTDEYRDPQFPRSQNLFSYHKIDHKYILYIKGIDSECLVS